MASPKFPEVQGGGSLIVAWQVKSKKVLVVGGGEVSHRVPAEYIIAHDPDR
jgi:precorrin-2 dehydrogenase/sirohydrochlorin ferrochelatase